MTTVGGGLGGRMEAPKRREGARGPGDTEARAQTRGSEAWLIRERRTRSGGFSFDRLSGGRWRLRVAGAGDAFGSQVSAIGCLVRVIWLRCGDGLKRDRHSILRSNDSTNQHGLTGVVMASVGRGVGGLAPPVSAVARESAIVSGRPDLMREKGRG